MDIFLHISTGEIQNGYKVTVQSKAQHRSKKGTRIVFRQTLMKRSFEPFATRAQTSMDSYYARR